MDELQVQIQQLHMAIWLDSMLWQAGIDRYSEKVSSENKKEIESLRDKEEQRGRLTNC